MTASARKPKPPQSPAQRQRELARLLVRMDEMLKITAELAVRARARVSVGGLNRYRRFAKRVRDFFALASVAEEKLYSMPELAESPMATALDRLHARMVVIFVEGSAAFFALYRRVPELPLGAHEICGVELRGLNEIRKFLDDERYDGERGQALRRQADLVMDLMHDVMERVPPLEDFGDLPSISPKGVSRQPIKTPPKRAAAPPPAPEPEPEHEPVQFPPAPPGWSVPASSPDWEAPPPPAWSVMTPGAGDSETWVENDEYDDSAYLDDAPDDVEYPSPPTAAQQPAPAASRGEPSPLVRELTLDMVEAEERRAAMAERLAASGRGAPPANPPAAAPAPTPPAPVPAPADGPPRAAAPFRAPTGPRPLRRT